MLGVAGASRAIVACAGLVACTASEPAGPGGQVALHVAPLSLAGIGVACYDARIGNGSGTVWAAGTPAVTRIGSNQTLPPGPLNPAAAATPDAGALCSDRFGNGAGGDIAYVAPCDASSDSSESLAGVQNSVTIWIDGLYNGALTSDVGGWVDPCPSGCTLEVDCRENADTSAVFDFTIARAAEQGFFDVAINFDDIFCSAKVDCDAAEGGPNLLLNHPAAPHPRVPTAVFAFACTAGPGADTHIYMDPLVLTCSPPPTPWLVPNQQPLAGNVFTSNPPGPLLQVATYRGIEQLTQGDPPVSLGKVYYNTALALDPLPAGTTCSLRTTVTAHDGPMPGFATPSGAYPLIEVNLPVFANGQGLACGLNPLDDPNAPPGQGVFTSYTPFGTPRVFPFGVKGDPPNNDVEILVPSLCPPLLNACEATELEPDPPASLGVVCPTLPASCAALPAVNPIFYWQFEAPATWHDSFDCPQGDVSCLGSHHYEGDYLSLGWGATCMNVGHGMPTNGYLDFVEQVPQPGPLPLPAPQFYCRPSKSNPTWGGFNPYSGMSFETMFQLPIDWMRDEGPLPVGTPVYTDDGFMLSWNRKAIQVTIHYSDGSNSGLHAFYLADGVGERSWASYADGEWHHLAVVADANAGGKLQLWLDGKLPFGFEVPLGGVENASKFIKSSGGYTLGHTSPHLVARFDEMARYGAPLPPTLVAQHAAEGLAGGHYSLVQDVGSNPPTFSPIDHCATQVQCASVPNLAQDPRYWAPTDTGTPYHQGVTPFYPGGVPLEEPVEQLRSWPLPRYAQGHGMRRNLSWIDPAYAAIAAEGDSSDDKATDIADFVEEIAVHWNYYLAAQQYAWAYWPHGTGSPGSYGWADAIAAHPELPMAIHVFSDVFHYNVPPPRLAGAPLPWGNLRVDPDALALSYPTLLFDMGAAIAADLAAVIATTSHPLDLFDIDTEGVFFSPFSYYLPWMLVPGSPSALATQSAITTFGCLNTGTYLPVMSCLGNAKATSDIVDGYGDDLIAGLRSTPQTLLAESSWYDTDGFPDFHASMWSFGARDPMAEEPGQLFQPTGFRQKLAAPAVYAYCPECFDSTYGPNHALDWLRVSRAYEIFGIPTIDPNTSQLFDPGGNHLFWPYLAAGWSADQGYNQLPGQYLGFAKAIAALGAVAFSPGVFNDRRTFCDPFNPNVCELLPTPYVASTYTWQAAIPPYAQAAMSRIEDDLRASVLTWHSANSGNMIRRPAFDPRTLVVTRQVLDAGANPRPRWIIAASYQPYSFFVDNSNQEANTITQLAAKERPAHFALGGAGAGATSLVEVPAPQEGALYTLDLTSPASPVLVQYDAWHDWRHPSYWAKDFRFDAEVNDGETAGSLGESITVRTEAPGIAQLDFAGFTTYLAIANAPNKVWPLAQSGLAPRARFVFESRTGWSSQWRLWIRARNISQRSGALFASLDGTPGSVPTIQLGCVQGAEWQWVHVDVRTGLQATFQGVTSNAQHTLDIAWGDGAIEIDKVELLLAGEARCPEAAPCQACAY